MVERWDLDLQDAYLIFTILKLILREWMKSFQASIFHKVRVVFYQVILFTTIFRPQTHWFCRQINQRSRIERVSHATIWTSLNVKVISSNSLSTVLASSIQLPTWEAKKLFCKVFGVSLASTKTILIPWHLDTRRASFQTLPNSWARTGLLPFITNGSVTSACVWDRVSKECLTSKMC